MVQLYGTSRQIEWAEKIRKATFAEMSSERKRLAALDAADSDGIPGEQTRQKLRHAMERIETVRSSPWWIDTRGMSMRELISRMMLERWPEHMHKPRWKAPLGPEQLRERWAAQEARSRQ